MTELQSVYLLGLDGAGKSTVGEAVAALLRQQGVQARLFYARHFPFLMVPLKLAARRAFKARPSGAEYAAYSGAKRSAGGKHRLLARVYAFVWCADFLLVTWLRLLLLAPRAHQRRVIDRYYLDVAINIASSLGWGPDAAWTIAARLARFLPKPGRYVYLKVPVEVALSRKQDIPNRAYLDERVPFYEEAARRFQAPVIDGTAPVETVAREIALACWPGVIR